MSRFIDEHRGRFGVEPICRTLGVSASAFYHRRTGARCRRVVADERLLEQIERVHEANYCCYGYRRRWLELTREGVDVGRDRVKRLMRVHGIRGAKRRGKPWRTTIPDPAPVRPPDRVDRDFTAAGPDRLWVADFCYLRCWEGVVFFAFVIDVWSRRVIGWQLAPQMRTDLVLDALRMAHSRRRAGADVELVHHSDAGSQYTSYAFTQVLDDHRVLASIGSVGDAYDNALAESFIDSFKTELIADRVWRTRAQLELAIVEWIGWFNNVRLHAALGDRPPLEFERTELSRRAATELAGSAGSNTLRRLEPPNPVSAEASPAHTAPSRPETPVSVEAATSARRRRNDPPSARSAKRRRLERGSSEVPRTEATETGRLKALGRIVQRIGRTATLHASVSGGVPQGLRDGDELYA